MAVFLLFALFAIFGDRPEKEKKFQPRLNANKIGILGGPIARAAYSDDPIISAGLARAFEKDNGRSENLGALSGLERSRAVEQGSFFGGESAFFRDRSEIVSYETREGDSIAKLADWFSVSTETILGANPELRRRGLILGEKIKILPMDGILYRVGKREVAEEISDRFGVSLADIQKANGSLELALLAGGEELFIPGNGLVNGTFLSVPHRTFSGLKDYFIEPTSGFNWGRLHNNNAVDIANACGTEVVASAEGLVVPDKNYPSNTTGWNGGYGHFVLVEHPNGTRTRYAHLEKIKVEVGDYVGQGQQIGTMGATGNVHGPTGCHLHYEVIGAENPLAR